MNNNNSEINNGAPQAITRFNHINAQSMFGNQSRKEYILEYLLESLENNEQIDIFGISEHWCNDRKTLQTWINHDADLSKHYSIITDHTEASQNMRGQGVSHIVSKTWMKHHQKTYRLPGRCLLSVFTIKGNTYIFGTIYPPSNHDVKELRSIQKFVKKNLEPHPEAKLVIGGDWNACISTKDRNTNTVPFKNPLMKYMLNLTTDIWRIRNPTTITFTHESQTQTTISKARLDFYLISPSLVPKTEAAWIQDQPFIVGLHHKLIGLSLKLDTQRIPLNFISGQSKRTKIHIDRCTTDLIQRFNEKIENTLTMNYQDDESIDERKANLTKAILTAIEVLPHTKATQVNANANRTSIQRYQRRLHTKHWKQLTKLQHEFKTNVITEIDYQNKLTSIMNKHNVSRTSDDPTTFITQIRKHFETIQQQQLNQTMQVHRDQRARNFIEQQKRHINNIFENRIQWNGPTFTIKDDEFIADPERVKEHIHEHFQKIYTANDQPSEHDENWNIYMAPRDDIDPTWYQHLTEPINMQELRQTINDSPRNKAPGPTGVTFDMLKLVDNTKTLEILLMLINESITSKNLPLEDRMAEIILLAKTPEWKGNLDQTRPITLLETVRKLINTILTNRLTMTIENHNILKGHNYGFRKGRSTTDVLLTIRSCIDTSHLAHKPLLIACLDIQKAYDTVPFTAIKDTMKRIRIPEQFIDTIIAFNAQRTIVVQTPYGNTETFTPTKGLPQGENMSPILWNIFYDPLLTRLEEESTGYRIPNADHKISAVSFADDLHPISETVADMQKQFDIIHSYLHPYQMLMKPSKCHVISNKHKTDEQFPSAESLKINDQPITDIRDKTEITRILGVQWSLGTNHEKTTRHATEALERALNLLQHKHCPGKLAVHLTNTVIIPRLQYQLQLLPVTDSKLETIDRKIRRVIRSKSKLPNNQRNDWLHSKLSGLGLTETQTAIPGKLISDTMVAMNRDDMINRVLQSYENLITNKMKLPMSILAKPIKRAEGGWHKKFMLANLSQHLYQHGISMKTSALPQDQNNLADSLPLQTYSTIATELSKYNLTEVSALAQATKPTHTISWSNLTLSRRMIRKNDLERFTIPNWFQQILTHISTEFDPALHSHKVDTNFRFDRHRQENQIPQDPEPIARIGQPNEEISIWTDGSLNPTTSDMGAASLCLNANQDELEIIQTRPPPGIPSSTKAELWAIFQGIKNINPSSRVSIYTDSQAAIDGIKAFIRTPDMYIRRKLKQTNSLVIQCITELMANFNTPPKLVKVKGHSNIPENEAVDQLAKQALTLPMHFEHLNPVKPRVLLYDANNHTALDIYPAHLLADRAQRKYKERIEQSLQVKWGPLTPLIDIQLTIRLTHTGLTKLNHLDTVSTREQAFRIKLLAQNLAVQAITSQWSNTTTPSPLCPRCKTEEETQEHLFTCQQTQSHKQQLRTKLITNIKERIHQSTDWKKLNHRDMNINYLITNILQFDNENFLESPWARGLIPTSTRTDIQAHENFKKNASLWILYIYDCWLTTFYQEIWKPRCTLVYDKPKQKPKPKQPRVVIKQIISLKRTIDETTNEPTIKATKKQCIKLFIPKLLYKPAIVPATSQIPTIMNRIPKRTRPPDIEQPSQPKTKRKKENLFSNLQLRQ